MPRTDRYLVLFETMCPNVFHPSESRTFMYFFFKFQGTLFIFCYLFAYYINKTYSFELKHNNMKTKKWLHMKKEHNTFKDSSLNYNFTIRTVICDFFPYPWNTHRDEENRENTSSASSLIPPSPPPSIQGNTCNFSFSERPPIFSRLNVKVLLAQSYLTLLTLCDLMVCSPPGSFVRGIFQARILERIAISFSRGSPQPRNGNRVSCTAGSLFTIRATREAQDGFTGVLQNSNNQVGHTRLWTFSCPKL